MNKLIALLLFAWLPLGASSVHAGNKMPAPPAPPVLQDFAWQQELKVSGQEAAYRLELPASVYTGSRRTDLGDVRVFNGNGELLPYAFLPAPAPPAQMPPRLRLPHFPIHSSNAGSNSSGISLHLQADRNGQLKSLRLDSREKAAAGAVSSFILDASRVKQPIIGLRLGWAAPSGNNIVALNVEASDNLQDWQLLRSAAPLVNLRLGEEQLQRDRIDLAGVHSKYLRLSWTSPQHAITLDWADAEVSADALPRQILQWHNVSVRAGETSGEYLFEGEGLPVESLRIALPQANTVVPYRIFHRPSNQLPWRESSNSIAYRLIRDGQEISSPEIQHSLSRDPYWRLLVDQRGGGLGTGLPKIALGWAPQQILFIARGNPPYTLAFGNPQVHDAAYAPDTLLPGFRADQTETLPVAQLGSLTAVTNTALAPEAKQFQRNKWILWGVLLLGVAVLAGMVWRLLRQMNPPSA